MGGKLRFRAIFPLEGELHCGKGNKFNHQLQWLSRQTSSAPKKVIFFSFGMLNQKYIVDANT